MGMRSPSPTPGPTILVIHRRELRVGGAVECWWQVGCRVEEDKCEKKWDKSNSIINKIYFKIKKV